MRVIYIGSPFPDNRYKEILRDSKGIIDNAANNFQSALVTGLRYYFPDLEVISLPAIGQFPKGYRKMKFAKSNFVFDSKVIGYTLGFINLPIIKHYSRFVSLKRKLKNVLDPGKDTIVFVYGMHSPYLKAINDLDKKYAKRIKTCLIVPDLPQFMSGNNNPVYKLLKMLDSRLMKKYLQIISSFVLLTKYMAEELKVGERPWVVVEGIFAKGRDFPVEKPKDLKVILYTGNLAKRYGISNLLDAFKSINEDEYRLWICGDGDYKDEIESKAIADKRIKYWGQLSSEKVFQLQKKATVLVNPRTSDGEYTKYSFPSKVIEYLGSGTPTIIHPLPGIPIEYFKHVFISKQENSEGLRKTILEVCKMEQEKLDEFGEKARTFILENKSPEKQAYKIFNMLNRSIIR